MVNLQSTRIRVARTVNQELIKLYWEVGRYISNKFEASVWVDSFVDDLANDLSKKIPDLKGFNKIDSDSPEFKNTCRRSLLNRWD